MPVHVSIHMPIKAFEGDLATGGRKWTLRVRRTLLGSLLRFLLNAIEIYGDHLVGECGLCEKGEDCVYIHRVSQSVSDGAQIGTGMVRLSVFASQSHCPPESKWLIAKLYSQRVPLDGFPRVSES